jgi:hypothetical protein
VRMITQEAPYHNATAARSSLFLWGLMVLLLLTVTACSKDAGTEGKPVVDGAKQSTPCDLTTDTSAWIAFKELADRIAAQEPVSQEELDAFGDQPSVTVWRNSLEPGVPAAHRVGNWLEGTFWKELGRQGKQKPSTNRAIFMRSYHYSLDNRDRIDERLAELTGPRKCDVADLAHFWIEPDRWSGELTIHFLPARPEIRIFEGSLLVDTGVVGAARVDQVIRSMAGLLYRKYQIEEGPNPIELEGAEAVAHLFRLLMNEGLAGWIEKTAIIEFDLKHWKLSKFLAVPEDYFAKTQQAVSLLNGHLGSMFDDEAVMTAKGQTLAEQMGVSNLIAQTGYGMAAVIDARLGEDRLRDAGRSVPAFLAAYQEAASLNAVPVPVPGKIGVELFQTVPPLEVEVFTELHAMLTRFFPE